ncbi:carboxylating nicotinate-nucleotide diphosphorylase [Candidatus Margulisiibacteriota bacterium]
MNKATKDLIKMALAEDVGIGDVTTELITSNLKLKTSKAQIITKETGMIAGLPLAKLVFEVIDKKIKFTQKVKDGKQVKKGAVIAEIKGSAESILKGERLVLNFLQQLSGVATLTNQFVELVKGTRCKILDTRKTTPLWRGAEKYAVLAGGGSNHRFGLYDAILIKDNHIVIAGGIDKAIRAIKANRAEGEIEIETKNIKEVKSAITAGADKVLLDNMDIKTLKQAVRLCKKNKMWCEASGGVNLRTVRAIAKTGVDAVSIGALTHSAKALDISLKIESILKGENAPGL